MFELREIKSIRANINRNTLNINDVVLHIKDNKEYVVTYISDMFIHAHKKYSSKNSIVSEKQIKHDDYLIVEYNKTKEID